jgi:hypothetical protein
MVPDIFISHSHKDDRIADLLKDALESRGMSCWVDHRDGDYGEIFPEQIVEMIESSRVFILIFSSFVATSGHIKNEVGLAFEENLRMMPFRLDDTPYPRLFKYYLRAVNWMEAYPGPVEGYIDELADDVSRHIRSGNDRLKPKVPDVSPVADERSPRCLFIVTPDKDSPKKAGQLKEQGRLRDWLVDRGVACDYLEGRGASVDNVIQKLRQNKYDIIHFFGPVVTDGKEHALALGGGTRLTPEMIKEHVKGSPIVVLDGNWSGSAAEGRPIEALDGIADTFLRAGSIIVVGLARDIPEQGIRAFNEKFYESALAGMSFRDAIRQARKLLMSMEYGKAWACFKMYGDQARAIKREGPIGAPEVDDEIRLRPEDFEASAFKVVEQAIELGRPMGGVDTSHLFTALLAGQNDVLRRLLNEQGVAPERLREDFLDIFKAYTSRDRAGHAVTFSDNFKGILRDARSVSRRGRITEEDILTAFVNRQGGSTGQFLREEFGIDVEALAPQFKPSREPAAREHIPGSKVARPDRIGGLKREYFTDEAWEALAHSAIIAKEEAGGLLGSPQLFMGMYGPGNGALRKALNRLGFDFRQEPYQDNGPSGVKHGDMKIELTKNVLKTLKRAGEHAAAHGRNKISDADIMEAFVECGGGETGKFLRSSGFDLKMLTTKVFRDDGGLDQSRFDEESRRLLSAALECAGGRGNKKLRTVHMVYAMLMAGDGELAAMVRRQGIDPKKMAGMLTRSGQMPVEGPAARIQADAFSMELSLIRALCAAGVSGRRVGAGDIKREILSDKSSRVIRFLEDQGVKWEG